MAQLIQPSNVKVLTKDGEITVSVQIDLNINLNQQGITFQDGKTIVQQAAKKDDDVAWVIPDFGTSEKIKFGK